MAQALYLLAPSSCLLGSHMRVFSINTVCGTGSTGTIVRDIADMLLDQQHQPLIAYGFGHACNIDKSATYKIHSKADYYAHNLRARITDHTGLYSKGPTKKLIHRIKEFNPDLIHLHNIHGYYLNYEILFSYFKEAGIPVIWTIHDCWPFTGHCTHFSLAGCYQWQQQCYNCTQLKRYPKCYFAGDVYGNYLRKKEAFCNVPNLTLVTPSQWLAEVVKSSFLKEYPVEVIPNGIDLEVFNSDSDVLKDKHGSNGKIRILGVASHWNEAKGLYDFFKLSEKLDEKYQLYLVGLNNDQMKKKPSSVIALPRTSSTQELVSYYSSADIFINLSYEETMGMTTVEAMACGTPVIVYNRTALPETLSEGCGEAVEAGNITAVVRAIERISGSKADRKKILLLRASMFEKNRQYQKYLDLYKSVLYEM